MTSLNDNQNADFSDVGSYGSTSAGSSGGSADFSDVKSGGSTTVPGRAQDYCNRSPVPRFPFDVDGGQVTVH